MQGKIFAIPYAAWIAAFVFDVLIIIDSYPAALLLFLLDGSLYFIVRYIGGNRCTLDAFVLAQSDAKVLISHK